MVDGMWISFPIGGGARIIIPWPLIPIILPIVAVVFILRVWWRVLVWIWKDREDHRPPDRGDTIRVKITAP